MPAAFIRSGNAAIAASRAASVIPPQRAISSRDRPHPEHSPDAASITQTLMQGDETNHPALNTQSLLPSGSRK